MRALSFFDALSAIALLAFAAYVFAAYRDREALLSTGGPRLAGRYGHLFVASPTFDKIDVLEARLATVLGRS